MHEYGFGNGCDETLSFLTHVGDTYPRYIIRREIFALAEAASLSNVEERSMEANVSFPAHIYIYICILRCVRLSAKRAGFWSVFIP